MLMKLTPGVNITNQLVQIENAPACSLALPISPTKIGPTLPEHIKRSSALRSMSSV